MINDLRAGILTFLEMLYINVLYFSLVNVDHELCPGSLIEGLYLMVYVVNYVGLHFLAISAYEMVVSMAILPVPIL